MRAMLGEKISSYTSRCIFLSFLSVHRRQGVSLSDSFHSCIVLFFVTFIIFAPDNFTSFGVVGCPMFVIAGLRAIFFNGVNTFNGFAALKAVTMMNFRGLLIHSNYHIIVMTVSQ